MEAYLSMKLRLCALNGQSWATWVCAIWLREWACPARSERKEKKSKKNKRSQSKTRTQSHLLDFEAGHVCYPQTVLTRFAGEWENIDTLDFRLWSHSSSTTILGVSKSMQAIVANTDIGYCLVTQESNDQATAAPAPAVSDWLDISLSLPMVTVRVMACHLTFSFLFFSSSLLVDESEHNRSSVLLIRSCSNRVTHISIVSPQPLKLRSLNNLAQLGSVESFGGCTGVDQQRKMKRCQKMDREC